jgi:hypothetical protein
MAGWQSGDAADCKSVYPGSIPGSASISTPILEENTRNQTQIDLSFPHGLTQKLTYHQQKGFLVALYTERLSKARKAS